MTTLRHSNTKNKLSLEPIGYSSPSFLDDEWEDNWLDMHGTVQHGNLEWSFDDPALTTWELAELLEWADSLLANNLQIATATNCRADIATPEELQENGWLTFTEPNLAFAYMGEVNNFTIVRVRLSGETAPPNSQAASIIDFHVNKADLRQFWLGLTKDVESFPKR